MVWLFILWFHFETITVHVYMDIPVIHEAAIFQTIILHGCTSICNAGTSEMNNNVINFDIYSLVQQASLLVYRLKPLTSVNSFVVDDMAVYFSMTKSLLFPKHLFWLTTPFLAPEDFSVDPKKYRNAWTSCELTIS